MIKTKYMRLSAKANLTNIKSYHSSRIKEMRLTSSTIIAPYWINRWDQTTIDKLFIIFKIIKL